MPGVRVLLLAAMFATTSAFAQQAVYRLPLESTSLCPVSLKVTHGQGLPVAMVARSLDSLGFKEPVGPDALPVQGQGIHLMLTNTAPRAIVAMEITVHGLSGKLRTVPAAGPSGANASPNARADFAKTIHLDLDVKRNGKEVRDLTVSDFTAVTSVEVKSVEYANGSRWKARLPRACEVFPDPMMLVAAR